LLEIGNDERFDMTNTPHTNGYDEQRDLAARIERRRQTAETALAMFDGNRLALIAALSRQARARSATPSETTMTGALPVRRDPSRDGRAAIASRPLLAAD
jgi:hypothetical protein